MTIGNKSRFLSFFERVIITVFLLIKIEIKETFVFDYPAKISDYERNDLYKKIKSLHIFVNSYPLGNSVEFESTKKPW
ncbi:hypothetical protein AVL50_17035 [Flammeovirga sp. SJP92]|nr:hypothetical protein AVL50_17035 [Flammeovirga sp. SJP92]